MKRDIPVIVVALFLVGLATVVQAAVKPQTTCPVSGEKIDKDIHLDYQGQRVYFCCAKCPKEFRKDPEKYFAKIAAEGVTLENIQTTCPVSGETLEGGEMGEPVSYAYHGRTIKFCCTSCIKKFEADPAKYLAKLPGETVAPK